MPQKRSLSDIQRIDALFDKKGVLTSVQIQKTLGLSQATVSRLLTTVPNVVKVGQARASRYVKVQTIADGLASLPVLWTDREGDAHSFGQLWLSCHNDVLVASDLGKVWQTKDSLPWFMAATRLQGYIARQIGRPYGIENPELWSVQQQLMIASRPQVTPLGAIALKPSATSVWLADSDTARRLDNCDIYLNQNQLAAAGSSAGGEQAKFESTLANGERLIVKFSPPRGTPFGERWHDLLCAEHLALKTLAQHDVPVANTRFLQTPTRSYLEVIRFDKTGSLSKPKVRHIVPLNAIHSEFIDASQQDWARSCLALAQQKRLCAADARLAQTLLAFGHMIANTDMHFGNLSFFVDSLADLHQGRFTLTPYYDMLPMRYRPDGGVIFDANYAPFDPFAKHDVLRSYNMDEAILAQAQQWALTFWYKASLDERLSPAFRQLAVTTAERLNHDRA
jgi:hypothetical protein